jgi:hypothetical protein
MLPEGVIAKAKALLVEGRLSQRSIARCLGISHGTVGAIANGSRRIKPNRHKPNEPARVRGWRCPRCGHISVLDPCQTCLISDGVAVHPRL